MFDEYPFIIVPVSPGYLVIYIIAFVLNAYFSWLFMRWIDK